MQKTDTVEKSGEGIAADGGSVRTVKSFTDLNGVLIEKEIDKFADQMLRGISAWREAGKILVELSRRQPDIFRLIQARHPNITESMLQTFARIGRNEIWPPLLADHSLGARRLLECHYEDQKEYADKPIEVAIAWDGKTVKTKKLRVQELSKSECAIVFGEDGKINTLDQQAWRLRPDRKPPEKIKVDAALVKDYTPRKVNVDLGYFSLVIGPDGKITATPCGKSPVAQPVRVMKNGQGYSAAIVVYYQEQYK